MIGSYANDNLNEYAMPDTQKTEFVVVVWE